MPRIPSQITTSLRKRSKSTTAKNGKTPPYPPLQHKCSHEGCDWSYKNPTDLSRHTARHLSPEEREKLMHHCPFPGCTHKSLQKSNMKTHYTSKHTTEKPYTCNQCDFGTSDPSCYHRHMCGQHGYVPGTEPRKRKSAAAMDIIMPDVVVVESEVEVPVASGSGSSPSPSPADAASTSPAPSTPSSCYELGYPYDVAPYDLDSTYLSSSSSGVDFSLVDHDWSLQELISLFSSTPAVNPKDLLYDLYPANECKVEPEKSDFSAYTQGRFEANVFLPSPTSDPSLSPSRCYLRPPPHGMVPKPHPLDRRRGVSVLRLSCLPCHSPASGGGCGLSVRARVRGGCGVQWVSCAIGGVHWRVLRY
ncbi:hypothetical protein R3P38DRAFT_2884773, partial [Favolaschia claudopus]